MIKRQFEAWVWAWVMSFTRAEVGGAVWLKVYGQLALLGVEIAALMFTFSIEKYVCFNRRNVNFWSSVNALLTLREGEESKVIKKTHPNPNQYPFLLTSSSSWEIARSKKKKKKKIVLPTLI